MAGEGDAARGDARAERAAGAGAAPVDAGSPPVDAGSSPVDAVSAPVDAEAEPVVDVRVPTPWDRVRDRLRAAPSLWLTRFVVLRLLGLVYLFAFLSLAHQIVPLVGEGGLLPVGPLIDEQVAAQGSPWPGFWSSPSLFWFGASDGLLVGLAWVGVALSAIVLAGYANAIVLGALWALYFSFVAIGQDWFAFGWDIQLCETGFLAIFLAPLLDGRPFPRREPPRLVIWLFRWLALRIMLGAGLIKLRIDPCWDDLTCLLTHFETQPLPNPLSRAFHALPDGAKAFGVVINHAAELVAPLFVFGPRRLRHVAALFMIGFQLALVASGNLSFLNWLTIVALAACLDDGLLERVAPRWLRSRVRRAREEARPSRPLGWAVAGLFGLYLLLSVEPAANLLSSDQRMNASFNRMHLGNAYGAFGQMIDQRLEIVIEGTAAAADPPAGEADWRAYELPCKPGDPMRRPCLAAPYQYRLDWQLWFAAHGNVRQYPWVAHLAWKLLRGDPTALALFEDNPFPDRPPARVRARLFRYRFAPRGDPSGAWWRRELVGVWLRPISADDDELIEFLRERGWAVR